MASKSDRIVIVGAGAFGISTALHLARNGYTSITVLDRSLPPVADGSSVDVSRIIRSDYADPVYAALGKEALAEWRNPFSPFHAAFRPCPFLLATQETHHANVASASYLEKNKSNLRRLGIPYKDLPDADAARAAFPVLKGKLASPGFVAYYNEEAGWADAQYGVALARDECIKLGVSFVGGPAGTVTKLETTPSGRIAAVQTLSGLQIKGDTFVLAAGAWTSSLVSLGKATISTAQIVGFIRLRAGDEYRKLHSLPIYINLSTGFFAFPTHPETGFLKIACHGFGYTHTREVADVDGSGKRAISAPPAKRIPQRSVGIPEEGVQRLREGLVEMLGEEYAGREFEKTAVCWYTETPTGDFIIDRHPRHQNLLVATGGSGHGYKFLPVIGKYIVQALEGSLGDELKGRWRLDRARMEDVVGFAGDGSRGGPARREFNGVERAKL